jgi:hypothetical protein
MSGRVVAWRDTMRARICPPPVDDVETTFCITLGIYLI